MTKKEMLALLRLLSALESWALSRGNTPIPDYLSESLSENSGLLEKYILGEIP